MKLIALGVFLAISFAAVTAGAAHSQSPTPSESSTPAPTGTSTSDGAMVISGQVPAPAGTPITVEVLDPTTIQGTQCANTTSTGGNASSSAFTVIVSADCVKGVSGNLRICWGQNRCSAVEFQAGTVDVGLLSTEVEQGVPEGGSGVTATPPGNVGLPNTGTGDSDELSLGGFALTLLLVIAGLCGVSWLVYARRGTRA